MCPDNFIVAVEDQDSNDTANGDAADDDDSSGDDDGGDDGVDGDADGGSERGSGGGGEGEEGGGGSDREVPSKSGSVKKFSDNNPHVNDAYGSTDHIVQGGNLTHTPPPQQRLRTSSSHPPGEASLSPSAPPPSTTMAATSLPPLFQAGTAPQPVEHAAAAVAAIGTAETADAESNGNGSYTQIMLTSKEEWDFAKFSKLKQHRVDEYRRRAQEALQTKGGLNCPDRERGAAASSIDLNTANVSFTAISPPLANVDGNQNDEQGGSNADVIDKGMAPEEVVRRPLRPCRGTDALDAFLSSDTVYYHPAAYVRKRALAEEFAQFCGGFDEYEQFEDVGQRQSIIALSADLQRSIYVDAFCDPLAEFRQSFSKSRAALSLLAYCYYQVGDFAGAAEWY